MSRRWVGAALIGLMVLFSVSVWFDLPDRIPTHWNFRWEVDGYSGGAWGAFSAPCVALAIWLLMPLLRRLDPRRANYERFEETFYTIVNLLVLFMAVMHVLTLGSALGWPIDMSRAMFALLGLIFIVLGNFMPRLRSNWWMGVRTPWTLDNDRVWRETHRMAGWTFVGGGVLALVSIILPEPVRWQVASAGVAGAALLPVVWSYVLWRRYQRPETTT